MTPIAHGSRSILIDRVIPEDAARLPRRWSEPWSDRGTILSRPRSTIAA
jgi:hypothetical protein